MLQRVSLSGADAAWIQGRSYESLLSYIPRSEWTAVAARYAVTMTNLNGAGHYISALNISYNNLSNGYTLSPFYEHATPVSATDITSAICDNIGADDLYNPAVLNMRLAGRQLTTAYMLT